MYNVVALVLHLLVVASLVIASVIRCDFVTGILQGLILAHVQVVHWVRYRELVIILILVKAWPGCLDRLRRLHLVGHTQEWCQVGLQLLEQHHLSFLVLLHLLL